MGKSLLFASCWWSRALLELHCFYVHGLVCFLVIEGCFLLLYTHKPFTVNKNYILHKPICRWSIWEIAEVNNVYILLQEVDYMWLEFCLRSQRKGKWNIKVNVEHNAENKNSNRQKIYS